MSQRITPYWIGSVAHLPLPPKYLSTGPKNAANQYGSTSDQKRVATVLPLTAAQKKKDVPQP